MSGSVYLTMMSAFDAINLGCQSLNFHASVGTQGTQGIVLHLSPEQFELIQSAAFVTVVKSKVTDSASESPVKPQQPLVTIVTDPVTNTVTTPVTTTFNQDEELDQAITSSKTHLSASETAIKSIMETILQSPDNVPLSRVMADCNHNKPITHSSPLTAIHKVGSIVAQRILDASLTLEKPICKIEDLADADEDLLSKIATAAHIAKSPITLTRLKYWQLLCKLVCYKVNISQ
jgi:fructose-specific phosphotransferase system component IIB